jgi:hypothetical protein
LRGWLDPTLAIDVRRAERVQRLGYRVWTQVIPGDVTPKNRLLLAAPARSGGERGTSETMAADDATPGAGGRRA